MKFELEPDNRNCTDEVLLDDLRAVACRLGKPSLTKDEYNEHGRFSTSTVQNRFGSWIIALQRCGLSVQKKRRNIPHAELIADLDRVAIKLGKNTVTQRDYHSFGKYSAVSLARAFGSWVLAIEKAGLRVSLDYHRKIKDGELFSNMAEVWEKVGRQPKQKDFHPPISRFSDTVYTRRFGSWRKALETFVASANAPDNPEDLSQEQTVGAQPVPEPSVGVTTNRTPRNPSWRLRFLVMRRDNFRCRACGRTQGNDPETILDVDHIKAWSKGGETTFDNLQTLCRRCNIGKSDLSMHEDGG